MCGIVAVLRRPPTRSTPELGALTQTLQSVLDRLNHTGESGSDLADISAAAEQVAAVDQALRGVPGVLALNADQVATAELTTLIEQLSERVHAVESIELHDVDAVEAFNAALIELKDAVWALSSDRLRTALAIRNLARAADEPHAISCYWSIQQALSSLDRLEVRGRDSAGLHVLITGSPLTLESPGVEKLVARRSDALFRHGSVRHVNGCWSLVYKAAAEIGELGDNTAALRSALEADELLRLLVTAPTAEATVVAHTRWASVGIISEANAHPVNSDETELLDAPYVIAALNGDVDNHGDLRARGHLAIAPEITTDAKVIPTLLSRALAAGTTPVDAFRSTVETFEGSVAIAASSSDAPGEVQLALRGSGQALYIGLAEDAYIVASEPYGFIEEAPLGIRMDGEAINNPGNPVASQGQIVTLTRDGAGTLEGITRHAYDGTELPVSAEELMSAGITTRDIDRGSSPHFLLKEIGEAPASFEKTLRGKLLERDGAYVVELPHSTLPDSLRARLRTGEIRTITVIGQGTAAVAGQAVATAIRDALGPASEIQVQATLATELSGFGAEQDMHSTLVVAVSQSGTTTDTNRTVDVARAAGACVIAIVNRRGSDLTDKADGVLYTADGRDVEMSVASTKAFYAQVAAGFLLGWGIAAEFGRGSGPEEQAVLSALRAVPDAMRVVLTRREQIAVAARAHSPLRRYWAVVGNGPNRVAANEVRIKLSELCYKSIDADATEDKKHIDLSAEPMILVCAAGLTGSNADDVAKELAIYRAHKAAPVVICSDDDPRFASALNVIGVPRVHPKIDFLLSAMAGHLFGYEAALAIDGSAKCLREMRASIETLIGMEDGDDLLHQLSSGLQVAAASYFDQLRVGTYDGSLEASIAARLTSLLRYAVGGISLDTYEWEFGKSGTPSALIEDLTASLTAAIDALTRPIDAIKHQAKTVTVGISRSDETLTRAALVRAVLESGCARDHLSYRALRTLVALDPAVAAVHGFIRYRIDGDIAGDQATVAVVDRGGIAREIASRTDSDPRLTGTKHRVASEREVTIARGRRDGRIVLMIPEVKDVTTTGLTLLHVELHPTLASGVARAVLSGYRDRFNALKDAVTETEPGFAEGLLGEISLADLLTEPVYVLANHWRK